MEFIRVNSDNIEKEHICCAISNNNDCQVHSKKEWLKSRFDEGLVFLKANERGKCFIEYIPAEYAWAPIDANDFLYIDCLWVSGQFKGKGYSRKLLDYCLGDAREKGKKGLVILSATKKMPFLSDPGFLTHAGFQVADEAEPNYRLMYLPLDNTAKIPKFREQVKKPHIEEKGYVLYYTAQCPYTAKYAPLIEEVAHENQIPFQAIQITSLGEAKEARAPFTSYSLFYNGEFVTNEILSVAKFSKMITNQ